MQRDLFQDVTAFHRKFDLPQQPQPNLPELEILQLKLRHLEEELQEIEQGAEAKDLEQVFDGIIDLVYVALGLAYFCNLPFNEGWQRVHWANMQKVRANRPEDSKRGSTFDIIKPEGWQAPKLDDLIRKEKDCERNSDR
jgi:predicted HAD superfamily Cof-like phosphohydrolase